MLVTKAVKKYVRLIQKVIRMDGHETVQAPLDGTVTATMTHFVSLTEMHAPLPKLDPLESRRELWKRMFGSKPMPAINPNAADEYSGSLGKGMNTDPSLTEAAFEQLDRE